MSVLELPQSSRITVAAAIAALMVGGAVIAASPHSNAPTLVTIFFLSGFFADLLTACFHFGFDYIFPYSMPILGPISREFRAHHSYPTLDPSNALVNLTKGAYASLPLAVLGIGILATFGSGLGGFLVGGTIVGMSIWALFFHQIHAYAHMGSHLDADDFNARVAEIAKMDDLRLQKRAFDELFDTVPIPPVIRLLQRMRILLNPSVHNLHHVRFESDFSSVNGWSDPLTNPLFGTIARRIKRRQGEPAE